MPKMTIAEITELLAASFPGQQLAVIASLGEDTITMRMAFRPELARPGGTVSGPALMTLADTAAYCLLLAMAGPPAHPAATAALSINFLARPEPVDTLATARMLRLGRKLAVSTVELRSSPRDALVAHATVTYALPS